jgi:2-methylcitrate dehydratase PrpD
MTIALELWKQFGDLTADDIPADAETVGTQCILDWTACTLAGRDEPLARILREEYGDDVGPAAVVGTELRLRPGPAALVNGATGHALDFDDTHTGMGGHPTAPVLPAVLAVAEELGSSGAELLAAFVVGSEVEDRLGAALGSRPYARGWHVTSMVGVLGAAAGVARLLQLHGEQFANALGIAASQSSGLKANFGTMTKPLHAGQAAERGVMAAKLAARGFTANPEALEGGQGLASASGAEELRRDRLDAAVGEWLITQTLFKYHAACYLTHAAIESAGALRSGVGARPVDAVTVTVNPTLLGVCAIAEPRTGLQAKFSLRATTAMALLGDDTTDPLTFNDPRVNEPDLQDLLHRVRVVTDDALSGTQSQVEIVLAGGDRLHGRYDSGIPATDLAAQGRKLRAKFDALAVPAVGADRAAALAERIGGVRTLTNAATLFA